MDTCALAYNCVLSNTSPRVESVVLWVSSSDEICKVNTAQEGTRVDIFTLNGATAMRVFPVDQTRDDFHSTSILLFQRISSHMFSTRWIPRVCVAWFCRGIKFASCVALLSSSYVRVKTPWVSALRTLLCLSWTTAVAEEKSVITSVFEQPDEAESEVSC